MQIRFFIEVFLISWLLNGILQEIFTGIFYSYTLTALIISLNCKFSFVVTFFDILLSPLNCHCVHCIYTLNFRKRFHSKITDSDIEDETDQNPTKPTKNKLLGYLNHNLSLNQKKYRCTLLPWRVVWLELYMWSIAPDSRNRFRTLS